MQLRPFGKTGVQVSAIGFGCMGLVGWYGTRNDAESRATLVEAIDKGVTHLDTAASYQLGENEKFVGGIIRDRRKDVFIATKFGITRNAEGALRIDNRPEAVKASCEASLQRLGIERIDLFYLHRIDPSVPIEESIGGLKDLVGQGKLRFIGLSECSVATLRRACAVYPVSAVQTEYSLWSREPEEGMLAACRELGVTFVAYSPLGRGFLAGNFRTLSDLPADDHRRPLPRYQEANIENNARIAEVIRSFAQAKGCTPAQLALAWVLAQGDQVTAIPGMKTRTHLNENLGALDMKLSAAEERELRAKIGALTVQGDRHTAPMMKAIDL
jgi:aryl-alcohol dehydrogenase-like predicted oxidoreductase